jgi:hypothetical protein
MKRIVALQPDFEAQKSEVVEIVEGAEHIALMLPKCHPELNFIEIWWGARKMQVRKAMSLVEKRNVASLLPEMVKSFNEAPLAGVAKMWNKSLTYLCAYKHGMSPLAAAEIARPRASHRGITSGNAEEFAEMARVNAQREEERNVKRKRNEERQHQSYLSDKRAYRAKK